MRHRTCRNRTHETSSDYLPQLSRDNSCKTPHVHLSKSVTSLLTLKYLTSLRFARTHGSPNATPISSSHGASAGHKKELESPAASARTRAIITTIATTTRHVQYLGAFITLGITTRIRLRPTAARSPARRSPGHSVNLSTYTVQLGIIGGAVQSCDWSTYAA